MIFIGIDPGQSGGIGIVDERGSVVDARSMPDTDWDIFDYLDNVVANGAEVMAVLERVGASPQMGVVSAFKFGRGVGGVRMALVATGIPFDEVAPLKWQGVMGVRQPREPGVKREVGRSKDKNINKRRAQELFPRCLPITHAIADALLLAEYCRRIHAREAAVGPARPEREVQLTIPEPEEEATCSIPK